MKRFTIFIIALALISLACEGSAEISPDPPPAPVEIADAQPKAGRILAIDVTDPADGDYGAALSKAIEAGAEASFGMSLRLPQESTSQTPNFWKSPNTYYPTRGIAVDLVINPIDTNQARLPKDLQNLLFDDPEVISRFNNLLDYVFTQIPELDIVSLSIGNEIDAYLGTEAQKWAEYTAFYAATSAHSRTLRSGLVVGTKGMYDGVIGSSADYFQKINAHSDAIFVTYYPLNGDFTVRKPSTVHEDFDAITKAYPEKEIYFLELGYPSSEKCNSSEEKQAAFITETFRAWDTHAKQIKVINFAWLNEVSPEAVRDFEKYYGFSNRGFAAYLGSLGFLNYDGSEKSAFGQLKAEVEARGWQKFSLR